MLVNKKAGNLAKAMICLGFCIISGTKLSAQGDLMIFPKRIVFEDDKKIQEIQLANTGKDTSVYNVTFVQYRMNEFGDFKEISEPDSGQYFASPYLRLFPRQVVLAPNESQIVKVQVKKTNSMKDGEYRSHIYFRAVNSNQPLGKERNKSDSTTISVKLVPVFGVTIPCIIRKGVSNTSVSISDLEYESIGDSAFYLKMSFDRRGNMSTYGDISVQYINSQNKSLEVANVQGFAVYAPGNVRKSKIQLKNPDAGKYIEGKFKVTYSYKGKDKPIILAEEEYAIRR